MSDEEKNEEIETKPRSSTAIGITLSVLSFVIVLTVLSFINPEILIGWYIDEDIRTQLTNTHEMRVKQILDNISDGNSTIDDQIINVRFTFENDSIVDIRVSRAVEVFNELFANHEKAYEIYEGDEGRILELTWAVDELG